MSVTNIMLDVVPGWDGMGYEVYAKSVDEVVETLSKLGCEAEDAQGDLHTALIKLEAAQKDTERLDYLETLCEAYGFEDEHLGNRWVLDGPFCSARKCIDAASKAQGEAK